MSYEGILENLQRQERMLKTLSAQGKVQHVGELAMSLNSLAAAIIWLKAVIKIRSGLEDEEG